MNKTSALALVMVLAACGKEPRQQTAADSLATAAQVSALASQARVATPGDLAKPIDQYTGDEFYALTRGLQFTGGNERERRCRGCNSARTTRVRVDGVQGVDSVSAGNV